MPAWNHRHHEIELWGLPITLLLYTLMASVCLLLAAMMAVSSNIVMGLGIGALSVMALSNFWRKLRLGKKRSFDQVLLHNRQYLNSCYNDGWEKNLSPIKDYERRKLPRHIHQGCVLNEDGSITVALRYQGFSLYLDSDGRRQAHDCLRSILREAEKECVYEFHLCRQSDTSRSDLYRNFPLLRQQAFTRWIRDKMADTVAQRECRNCVYLLLTMTAEKRGWLGTTRALKEQARRVEKILEIAEQVRVKLPDARLDTANIYRDILQQCNDFRALYSTDSAQQCTSWFSGGQITEHADMLRLCDGRFLKTLWFENYPDATIGFICRLIQPAISMRIVQAIKPVSVYDRQAVQRDINISASMAGSANLASARIKLQAHTDMQTWCAEHDSDSFWNFFAVQLIDDRPERIQALARLIKDQLASQGGSVRDYADIQCAAWHYLLPGAAHSARRWRIDESEQLVGMAPVHVPLSGARTPLSLRLSTQNTPVNIGYRKGDVAHHVTIAMTGAGKSLDRCARILESYGVGIDIYALEIGQSLWWAIEAIGGQYHRLDPDEVMVNPFPDRNCCTNNELPIDMLATTTAALSMLLTNRGQLNQFELTATQIAMRAIYAKPERYPQALLQHLHTELLQVKHAQGAIVEAARRTADHLGAFLESAEGERLMSLPQLSFQPGAIGCDLSKIKEKTPRLLKFYLVFITLKFSQLAYANNNPAEIILDEMHEFVRLAPDVVGALIDGIARMGRKNANYINLITQEATEIEAIGSSVLNQILRKCLLYKQSSHDSLAARIGMPDEVRRAWCSWKSPLAHDFRYALECVDGDQWHELLLRFPEEIAILSRTDPVSLDLKRQISQITSDPFERIKMFQSQSAPEAMAVANPAP